MKKILHLLKQPAGDLALEIIRRQTLLHEVTVLRIQEDRLPLNEGSLCVLDPASLDPADPAFTQPPKMRDETLLERIFRADLVVTWSPLHVPGARPSGSPPESPRLTSGDHPQTQQVP